LALVPAAPTGAADVNGTLAIDPTRLAGVDSLGRMLLYAPDPLEQGSSISHWDVSATPNLLMEPVASPSVPMGEVDLTLPHLRDIGWPQGPSIVTIRVNDAPDQGFNDPTSVPEAPDNPGGSTLGGQRLAAMRWAAGIWAADLGSTVEINVESAFVELDCDPDDGAVLAAAGAQFLFFDFPNAPRQGTWYHGALAESLANENLSNTEDGFPLNAGDLIVTFNSQIDEGCLAPEFRYYYGLDGNTPARQVSFAMVALHEMAHGLGFTNFVNGASGSLPSFPGIPPMPDIYTVFTFDNDIRLHWNVMTDAERRSSAVNTDRVVWDGPQTTGAAPDFLDVVDRGTCLFNEKVKNAKNAGAVSVIVVNNLPHGLPPMGGDDSTITSPSAGISQADGNHIKGALGLTLTSTRRASRRVTPVGHVAP
jgi:hypothetical protein